ncbi:MAG: VCBS repeat-containing protein [Planctomycetota bacterium]
MLGDKMEINAPLSRVRLLLAAALTPVCSAQVVMDPLDKLDWPVRAGGSRTNVVRAADLNGDGRADLVFGRFSGLGVYFNRGRQRFEDSGQEVWDLSADHLALGDIDGDGDIDVVADRSNWIFGYGVGLALYLNDGAGQIAESTGAFQTGSSYLPPGGDPTLIDVDGDRDLDVLVGSVAPKLLLNDGPAGFRDGTASHLALTRFIFWNFLAAGDVDLDGDVDLIFQGSLGEFRVQLNDGTGRFQPSPRGTLERFGASTLVDMDGDGDLDLLGVVSTTATRSRLLLNDGSGNFTDVTATHLPQTTSTSFDDLVVTDVDRDGDPDGIFVGNQNQLYLNDGQGRMTVSPQPLPMPFRGGLQAIDANGDGLGDFVVPGDSLWLGDGAGGFAEAATSRLAQPVPDPSGSATDAAFGDVDGDGDLDVVLAQQQARNLLLLNDGTGRYSDASDQLTRDAGWTTAVALADVDGDGDLDLYAAEAQGFPDRLSLNDGTGTFTDASSQLPLVFQSTADVTIADVDGDGDLDALTAGAPRCHLYLNDGRGTFTDAIGRFTPPIESDFVATPDLDGDGDFDLVLVGYFRARRSGFIASYLNDGTGRFVTSESRTIVDRGRVAQSIATGDIDGNGSVDLVLGLGPDFRGPFGAWVGAWVNDGTGQFTSVPLPPDPGARSTAALGDFDADGDLDILGTSVRPGSVEPDRIKRWIWSNDGRARFTPVAESGFPDILGRTTVQASVADIDADGDADALFPWPSEVWYSLHRQLRASWIPQPGATYPLDLYLEPDTASADAYALVMVSPAVRRIPAPPFGTFGLDPTRMAVLGPVLIPAPHGRASLSFRLPDQTSWVGVTLASQALFTSPAGAWLSNLERDVVVQ